VTGSNEVSGADSSVAAYEELRSRVLTGSTPGGHSGLLAVLRRGVAGWLTSPCNAPAPSVPLSAGPCSAPPTLPGELSAGVVQVLASMALASRPEMRTNER
jgi:hypothetical protein